MANLATAVIIASGVATFYNAEVMDTVVENRARWGHIDAGAQVVGYVALLDCDRVGDVVWLQAPDGRIVGPVMVADCAAGQHREARIAQGFAVDLSWELAQEFGVMETPSGKRVSVVDAPVGGFVVWDGDPCQQGEEGAEGATPSGCQEQKDRLEGPLSSACRSANGAGAQPLLCSGPAPF